MIAAVLQLHHLLSDHTPTRGVIVMPADALHVFAVANFHRVIDHERAQCVGVQIQCDTLSAPSTDETNAN